ncbi:MAG: PIG-L family deacetylase, partial [Ferruginibacter sp.]|nr:PIG-L family deacetylase [Cytophagales bacterium]
EAADRFRQHLLAHPPDTVLVPWRRDPHGDHRATGQLVHRALAGFPSRPRVLEYPIWVWALARPADWPAAGEVQGWRLDIRDVQTLKQRAIAAHQSQLTELIDDDPDGFRLTPAVLTHFEHPWEVFLEALPSVP